MLMVNKPWLLAWPPVAKNTGTLGILSAAMPWEVKIVLAESTLDLEGMNWKTTFLSLLSRMTWYASFIERTIIWAFLPTSGLDFCTWPSIILASSGPRKKNKIWLSSGLALGCWGIDPKSGAPFSSVIVKTGMLPKRSNTCTSVRASALRVNMGLTAIAPATLVTAVSLTKDLNRDIFLLATICLWELNDSRGRLINRLSAMYFCLCATVTTSHDKRQPL